MLKRSGAKVKYIGHKQLIKFQCHPTEFEAMEFVRQNTTIPIPKVFGAYNRQDGSQDLVLELVPGTTLNVAWQTLTQEQKTSIVAELAGYLTQLRCLQPPKEGFVGSLMLGSGYDHRLGGRRFGPFESIADFHKFVRRGDSMDLWAFDENVTSVHKKSDSYVTKFTHADMSPENILVKNGKITGIVDWEFSGWFPEYWEYTKMYFGWRPYREDFYHEMDKVITTYPEELAADKTILKAYDIWAYDIDRPRRSANEEGWCEWDVEMRRRIVSDDMPRTSLSRGAD
ncbi:kinase-like domain-containing protein [Rhexocercosporidium sp. MPI-PUGE-AT-0058]|nr:kinase-like domain-containing protein [Rhexocercosporidium sp. MPI-PUGE-AT-0058]